VLHPHHVPDKIGIIGGLRAQRPSVAAVYLAFKSILELSMNPATSVASVAPRRTLGFSPNRLGDVALATLWAFIGVTNVAAAFRNSDHDSLMSVAHRLSSALVLLLCAVLFIIRRPAKAGAEGLLPRVIAVAGTWMMPVAVSLPIRWHADWYLGLSTIALIVLTLTVGWAKFNLRRSFSIFAEARALIRTGPYGIVRHPLYATYSAMYLVMLISRFSLLAVAVTSIGIGAEVWRSRYEEGILRSAFPEYDEYAATTPAFIPGLNKLIK
jgi:protein-S-isoprenylcysteine O-methyltransferase Ste14